MREEDKVGEADKVLDRDLVSRRDSEALIVCEPETETVEVRVWGSEPLMEAEEVSDGEETTGKVSVPPLPLRML